LISGRVFLLPELRFENNNTWTRSSAGFVSFKWKQLTKCIEQVYWTEASRFHVRLLNEIDRTIIQSPVQPLPGQPPLQLTSAYSLFGLSNVDSFMQFAVRFQLVHYLDFILSAIQPDEGLSELSTSILKHAIDCCNTANLVDKSSPLYYRRGPDPALIKVLLQHKADPNARALYAGRMTLWEFAVQIHSTNADVMRIFLNHGANPFSSSLRGVVLPGDLPDLLRLKRRELEQVEKCKGHKRKSIWGAYGDRFSSTSYPDLYPPRQR
jgi:hypothetical protein